MFVFKQTGSRLSNGLASRLSHWSSSSLPWALATNSMVTFSVSLSPISWLRLTQPIDNFLEHYAVYCIDPDELFNPKAISLRGSIQVVELTLKYNKVL